MRGKNTNKKVNKKKKTVIIVNVLLKYVKFMTFCGKMGAFCPGLIHLTADFADCFSTPPLPLPSAMGGERLTGGEAPP